VDTEGGAGTFETLIAIQLDQATMGKGHKNPAQETVLPRPAKRPHSGISSTASMKTLKPQFKGLKCLGGL